MGLINNAISEDYVLLFPANLPSVAPCAAAVAYISSSSLPSSVWWNLSRRGSVRKYPSMQHLAPGLCLEQTPKPIFGPCYGASRPLLYARPIPFVISLPLSYSSAMSHSPILTIHLTQACPTQMDTRPHYPYHAPLTIIANATHFGTLL
jgi:hypothetical protein